MISKANDLGRVRPYRLLARIFRAEADAALLDELKAMSFPKADGALGEGYARLGAYLEHCGENAVEELAVDFATVFLAAGSADGSAAIPCESVYTSPKRLYMQQAWEDVRRVYAAHGLGRDDAQTGLHEDHLSLELEFMAWLIENGSIQEQKDFLNSHLLNWVPAFAAGIEKYARADFYKAAGQIIAAFLALEGEYLAALASGEVKFAQSYSVRADRMAPIFARLKEKYRIFAPKRFPGRGPKGGDLIRYGEIDAITEVVYKEKSHFSAKEVFYPISQTMFYFNGENCTEKELDDGREVLLFLRPCDLNAIRRLDAIFLQNGQPDLYYARMREKVKPVLLECRGSFDNCFCVSMGANEAFDYAAAVRIDDICALVEICDEELLPYFADEVPIGFTPEFVKENRRAARPPKIEGREQLGKVCALDYWKKYDEDCIACGGCNTVCPTCSCFDTVDIIYNETSRDGERRRVWSGCMLRDFTQTAGGGMARKTQGANMRFKVLHKMYDYKERFGGEHMCVGCGRCIDRCPKDIDYLDAVNGLANALEAGKGED